MPGGTGEDPLPPLARYCPLTSSWLVDNCLVKIASTAFAHGAMRECFRM